MPIVRPGGDADSVWRRVGGAVAEVDAVYRRDGGSLHQVWARPALPTLTAALNRRFDARGASAANLAITWVASGGSTVSVRRLSDGAAVPNTSNTSAIVAAPLVDEVFRVEARNSEGAVHVDLAYYRFEAPAFSGLEFGSLGAPGGARVPVIRGTLSLHPWLSPALSLDPEQDGFTSRQFARSVSTGNNSRQFRLQGNPRLQTQPVRSVTITLSAQLRIGGVAVGQVVARQLTARY